MSFSCGMSLISIDSSTDAVTCPGSAKDATAEDTIFDFFCKNITQQ